MTDHPRPHLNTTRIAPGSCPAVAHSEPVTTAPPAEPTSTAARIDSAPAGQRIEGR